MLMPNAINGDPREQVDVADTDNKGIIISIPATCMEI